MKKSFLVIILLSLSISTFGQSPLKGGFYIGLGANFNLVDYKETETNTLGLSNVNLNGNTIAQGYAGGPYDFPGGTNNIFSSSIQTGYYQPFKNSKWLWGAKLTYSYVGSSITKGEQHIPQTGAVGNTPFTGDAVVQSFEYQLTNQFTFTPYIGVSAKKAYFYLGAGPSYSQAKESANN